MSRFFVFVETPAEHRLVGRLLDRRARRRVTPSVTLGKVGDNEVVLFRTGIGPGPARSCAIRAFENIPSREEGTRLRIDDPLPDAVLVTGLCGGLSARLAKRDIVLYTECLSGEGKTSENPISPALTRHLAGLLHNGSIPFASVVGLTVPKLAVTPEEKRSWMQLGADVVDMESYDIAQVAVAKAIPTAVLRVASDVAKQRVLDLTTAARQDGTLNPSKVVSIGARNPLIAFRWSIDSLFAVLSLRTALACVLSEKFNLNG
jgi:nucleoside phosphorylase